MTSKKNFKKKMKRYHKNHEDHKELLDGLCGVVVFFAYDIGVEDSRGGLQGVYGGVYAQLCDFTGKYRSGVQERERSCRCGVGKVIGGDVYGLYRGD